MESSINYRSVKFPLIFILFHGLQQNALNTSCKPTKFDLETCICVDGIVRTWFLMWYGTKRFKNRQNGLVLCWDMVQINGRIGTEWVIILFFLLT